MSAKYEVGDILFYNGPDFEPFHILIEGLTPSTQANDRGASWPFDVYHFRILEDDDCATISSLLLDGKPYYTKVG